MRLSGPRAFGYLAACGAAWLALTYFGLYRGLSLPVWAVLVVGLAAFGAALLPFAVRSPAPALAGWAPDKERADRYLAVLMERLPLVVWRVDRDLRFTFVRGRGLEDLGVTPDDLVGTTIAQLFGREDPGHPGIHAYQEALEGRPGSVRLDWSGRAWEVRVEPLWKRGEVVGVLGVALDVTEQEDAIRVVEEQRVHLHKLFEEAPEGIVLVDENDRVLRVNSEFERMFGYARSEVMGRAVNELIVPEGRHEEAISLTHKVLEGQKVETEAVRRRKDGTLLDVSILATPVELDDERRAYGIYRDITRHKELQAQLLHSQRLEAVGQLAGGISHDFNNILTVILGQTQSLLDRLEDEKLKEDVVEIERAASRAAQLTGQLLTFSRRDVVSPRPVDLDDLILDLRDFLDRTLGEPVELVTELQEELPPVVADPGQLQQVIVNLVVNARDAMPEGGSIVVRTSIESGDGRGGARGGPLAEGDRVLLEVEDTGHGMSPEEAARVFEPFFTTKGPGEGTGLGMSIVYGIVERAGGTIDLETAPAQGTTFRIRLPAVAVEAPVAAAQGDGPGAVPADRATILLVDDDAPVLSVARRILEEAGHTVLAAMSGAEALRLSRTLDRPPDLLLTDIVMPEMSGQRLVAELKARWPDLRTLFMTGYTEGQWAREHELRPERAGDLIQKPFDANTLRRRVREALLAE